MDIRKIKKLIELLEESGIAEIEIKEGEEAVRISRMPTGAHASRCLRTPCRMPAPPMHAAAAAAASAAPPRPRRRAPAPERARGHRADGRHLLLGALARREGVRRDRR